MPIIVTDHLQGRGLSFILIWVVCGSFWVVLARSSQFWFATVWSVSFLLSVTTTAENVFIFKFTENELIFRFCQKVKGNVLAKWNSFGVLQSRASVIKKCRSFCIGKRDIVALKSRAGLIKWASYSDFFWSVFPRIRTEYGNILCISSYSVRMQENTDQRTLNTDTFHAVLITSLSMRFWILNEKWKQKLHFRC